MSETQTRKTVNDLYGKIKTLKQEVEKKGYNFVDLINFMKESGVF